MKTCMSTVRFANLCTSHMWGWIPPYCGSCPMACERFISIPGHFPPDASSYLPDCDIQNRFPDIATYPLGGKIAPGLRATGPQDKYFLMAQSFGANPSSAAYQFFVLGLGTTSPFTRGLSAFLGCKMGRKTLHAKVTVEFKTRKTVPGAKQALNLSRGCT